ncbi:Myo16 [Symbiodinium natans]|uniref:Myo16 protein n=1 Tax=Symbiodinium natans TaxID=878477 RepID=A0A812SDV5_9DINO|nr:Myo16 [Symbiodinium natans]
MKQSEENPGDPHGDCSGSPLVPGVHCPSIPSVSVSARTLGGREVRFDISSDEPLINVKKRIAEVICSPPFTVQLVHEGATLNDAEMIKPLKEFLSSEVLDLVIVRIPGKAADYRQLLTDFVVAANKDRVEEARQLLDQGAGFDADGNLLLDSGSNVLHLAVRMRLSDLALHLISRGVDLQSTNEMGRTPLMQACIKDSPAIIATLLAAKADVNIKDVTGRSAVYYAAMKGNTRVVEQLREAGVEPGELQELSHLLGTLAAVPAPRRRCMLS